MLMTTTPTGVRNLVDRYKDLFDISYTDLCALVCYFLVGAISLSQLVRLCPWTRSVSSLSRSVHLFPANRIMRRLRSSILKHYGGSIAPEHFVWAIDDTANPKYGKKIFRTGHWHGSSGPWFGQKVVVLALVDMNRGIALPAAYVIAPKKGDPNYKRGHDIAVDLLKTISAEKFPPLPVVLDSWYDSVEMMDKIEELGLIYVGELKSNRKARRNPGRYVPWVKLKDVFAGIKRIRVRTRFDSKKVVSGKKRSKVVAQVRIWLKNRKSPMNAVAVYNRRNGRDAFGYYVSTDLTMSGARIWEISRARWKIEVMFRDLKQHLSFGRLPCGGENAADVAICIPMLILVSLRLHAGMLWQLAKPGTIGDMVDKIRERSLTKSIDHLVRGNHKSIVCRLPFQQT